MKSKQEMAEKKRDLEQKVNQFSHQLASKVSSGSSSNKTTGDHRQPSSVPSASSSAFGANSSSLVAPSFAPLDGETLSVCVRACKHL